MAQDGRPLAMVTGASAGIGYHLARICAENGFDLVIAADQPKIHEAAEYFRAFGAAVDAVEADLATLEGVDRLYDAAGGRPVEALLANAGQGLGRAFLEQDFTQVRHVIDTNITGTVYLIQKIGRDMRARGHGRILITGSIAGFMPGTYQAVYNASKAFIDSFSFALRHEVKEQGITVTCLMPGFVAFPFGYSQHGNLWNAGDICDIPLDQTVEALSALRGIGLVGRKVGIYGMSRGAEHALLLVSLMVRDEVGGVPDAVAAYSPPDVICGAFHAARWRDPGDPGWQVWDPADRAWTWRGTSDGLLPTTPIEIERYGGPLFLSHGTADRMWSVEMTRRLEMRLRSAGRTPEIRYYEGENHILGSAASNEHHEHLIAFFQRHLAG